ncbi:MAG: SGNH/GDSL hydrolase family protein [Bacillota bacterium]|nr:SGNH/GDSL hydrolase family protein [Bacillota bacterium]
MDIELSSQGAEFSGGVDDFEGGYSDYKLASHRDKAPLDHADGSVTDAKIGNRTITNPSGAGTVSGNLTELLETVSRSAASSVKTVNGNAPDSSGKVTLDIDSKVTSHNDSPAAHTQLLSGYATNAKLTEHQGSSTAHQGILSAYVKSQDLYSHAHDSTAHSEALSSYVAKSSVLSTYLETGIDPVNGTAVASAILGKENWGNKVKAVSPSSTDDEYPSAKAVYTAVNAKQDTLTFDNSPKEGSTNPVTSGGTYAALDTKEKKSNKVTSLLPGSTDDEYPSAKAVYSAVSAKQDALTFDTEPKSGSTNPVTSGGVYEALSSKEESLLDYIDSVSTNMVNNYQGKLAYDDVPTSGSFNMVNSGGIYTALDTKENASNRVTAISGTSTDRQYPSAKATYTNLSNKVDKVSGKGLSENDFTSALKTKLEGLANVAASGSYNDLTNKPTEKTTPQETVTIDLMASYTGGWSDLKNYRQASGSIAQTDAVAGYMTSLQGIPVTAGVTYTFTHFKGDVVVFPNNTPTGGKTIAADDTGLAFSSGSTTTIRVLTIPAGYSYIYFNAIYLTEYSIYCKPSYFTYTYTHNLDPIVTVPYLNVSMGNLTSDTKSIVSPLYGKKIACLGDSIFQKTDTNGKTVGDYISSRTGTTVYNCAFGGTKCSYDALQYYSDLSFTKLVDAITSASWTSQDAATTGIGNTDFTTILTRLKAVDFSKIDILTIAYGTNDFTGNMSLDNTGNTTDITYYKGALRYGINKLLTSYPQLKIVLVTPYFRFWYDSATQIYTYPDTKTNTIPLLLGDYVSAMKSLATEYNLPYIDGFADMGINRLNCTYYIPQSDGTHHNVYGKQLLGGRIGGKLAALF